MKTTYQLTWEWNWIWHIKENLNQNMFTSELYISLHNLSSTRNEKISALIALFLSNQFLVSFQHVRVQKRVPENDPANYPRECS